MFGKSKLASLAGTIATQYSPCIHLVDVPFIRLFRLPLVGSCLQALIMLIEIGIAVSIITLGHLSEHRTDINVLGSILGDVIFGIVFYGTIFGLIAQSAVDAAHNSEKQEIVIRYQLAFSLFNVLRWSILVIAFYSNNLAIICVGISVETILCMLVMLGIILVFSYQGVLGCKSMIQKELEISRSERQKLIV